MTPTEANQPGRPRQGTAEDFCLAVAGGAWDAFKSLPRLLMTYLLPRLPIMGGMFLVVTIVHWILLVIVNDGFAKDSWAAPFIAVSGNFISSLFLYGFSSGLLWSFAFSFFRLGPVGAVMHFVTRPLFLFRLVKAADRRGAGLFVLGSGGALFFAAIFLNSLSALAAGLSVTFLGMSRPGMIFVQFLSAIWSGATRRLDEKGHGQFKLIAGYLRLFMAGLSPGFLVAAVLFLPQLFFDIPGPGLLAALLAIGLWIIGGLVIAGILFPQGPGGPSATGANRAVVAALVLGGGTALLYSLLELILPREAWAHDSGWSEGGRSVTGVLTKAGAVEGVVRSGADGTAAGGGVVIPPMGEETEEEPEKPTYGVSCRARPQTINLFKVTGGASATASTTDPDWSVAAMAAEISFSLDGAPASWIQLAEAECDGATKRAGFVLVDGVDLAAIPPASYPFRITATAPTPTASVSSTTQVIVTVAPAIRLVVEKSPAEKLLKCDGTDTVMLTARLVAEPPGPAEALTEAISSIAFEKGSDWLDFSEEVVTDDGKVINVAATNPDPARHEHAQPPSSVSVVVTARAGAEEFRKVVPISLAGLPELDVDLSPARLDLALGDKTPIAFRAFVEYAGEEPWQFRASLDHETYAAIDLSPETGAETTVTVTAPEALEAARGCLLHTKLHLYASQAGAEDLERVLNVTLAREGLQVTAPGSDGRDHFRVLANGKKPTTRIPFLVMIRDDAGKLGPSPAMVAQLAFSNLTTEDKPNNVLSVAQLDQVIDSARDDGSRHWKFWCEKEIPGDQQTHIIEYRATLPEKEGPDWEADFKIGIVEAPFGPGSKEWRIEYDKCRETLKHVPSPYFEKLSDLVERQAQQLGAEGLFYLRKKVWRIAQDLILAEGASGYESQAYWEDKALQLCEWTDWVCDIAFEALVSASLGPAAGMGVSMAKNMMKSALVAYAEGVLPDNFDSWFKDQVMGVAMIPGAMLTDPGTLMQHFKQKPAIAWSLAFIYQFGINAFVKKQSYCDSAINAARFCRDQAIQIWLTKKIIKSQWFHSQMDTSTPRDGARFWSGENGKNAADGSGGKPLNRTEGGQWTEKSPATEGLEWNDVGPVWEQASRQYAKNASGRVKVFNGKHGTSGDAGSIWNRVERPTLMGNPNVSSIEIYVPDGAGGWKLGETIHK